jgi:DNA-binding NarL/FixJ family response regulator
MLRLVPEPEENAVGAACPLTRRQVEVLELIARGLTNRQIAERLVLTTGTVANHIEHILRRLDVPNRAAAAIWLARTRIDSVGRPDGDAERPGER